MNCSPRMSVIHYRETTSRNSLPSHNAKAKILDWWDCPEILTAGRRALNPIYSQFHLLREHDRLYPEISKRLRQRIFLQAIKSSLRSM